MSMNIPAWIPDAVFYQIFPERFRNGDPSNDPAGTAAWGGVPDRENSFGGDLAGIVEKLDYVAGMGFNALYLNPIFRAGTNHKYDTHDYFAIDPAFGDDASFDRLVQEAHARGMRVVLDGVFNHCGLGFEPFQDLLRKGERSRYRDWFQVYGYPVRTAPVPNYATCGGAHYLPRLNTGNPEVEAFVHEVALHWLSRGIDGWRLDVPYEIATDFWRRFRVVVKGAHSDAYLVAEEWRDPSSFLRGDTFDGATHYLLRGLAFDFLIKNALTGEAFSRGLETLRSRLPSGSDLGMLTLLGGHDTARLMTECGGDADLAILLFTFLLTMPGAPVIYYGDENGMEGANDPDCRRPMVWSPDLWVSEVRTAVTRLIALRRRHACLRRGELEAVWANDRVYAYRRSLEGQSALVILNNSLLPRSIAIPTDLPDGTALVDALSERRFTICGGRLELSPLEPRRPLVLTASG
jgi:cyclomaltodextrinase